MATATRETKSIEKIETVEEEVITLTLTKDEAVTLKSLTLKIDGGFGSYCNHVSKIRNALDGVGIRSWSPRFGGRLDAFTMPVSGDE